MKRKITPMDLAVMGLLTALTVIASRYLKIEIGTMIRLNFSSSFIMLSGIWLGPVAGALVGLVSDLLGCLVGGYAINPLYTLSPVMVGVFAALCVPLLRTNRVVTINGKEVNYAIGVYALVIFAITLVTSSFYGTWVLSIYYGSPFWPNFWTRLGQGVISTVMNTIVVYVLYNSQVTRMIINGTRLREG